MDLITIDVLRQFSAQFELDSRDEAERFERLVCYLTLSRHYGDSFDTTDFLAGESQGIDTAAVIVNGTLIAHPGALKDLPVADYLDVTVVFSQADRGGHFDVAKLGKFASAVDDIFDWKSRSPRSPEIKNVSAILQSLYNQGAKFKRGKPECNLYFATTGTLTGDAALEAGRSKAESVLMSRQLFRAVNVELLGQAQLHEMYFSLQRAVQRSFSLVNSFPIVDLPGVKEAHLGLITARTLAHILRDEEGRILSSAFEDNVRDWLGPNVVNAEIEATLRSDRRQQFALMNNGITIIARKLSLVNGVFHVEDFQVVNGCQTCHAIFNQAAVEDSVRVPVRIISTDDEELINDIIRATNRQTAVPPGQFVALTDFPRKLERFFAAYPIERRLYFERRPKQYERLEITKSRVISQDNVIKAFASAMLAEPHGATRSVKNLRNRIGKTIFKPSHRPEPYYLSAVLLYWWNWALTNGVLERTLRPARFHILLAMRLLGTDSRDLPQMSSSEMAKLCNEVTERLWGGGAEALLSSARQAVLGAVRDQNAVTADGGIDRDKVRKADFTEAVKRHCRDLKDSSS